MRVEKKRQLSVYLENRVGALAEICKIIADRSINLIAICAIDTVEEAVLRIVPEDSSGTRAALQESNFRVIETDVLVIELPNSPGSTGRVATDLSEAGINIDYIYASAHPEGDRAVLVLRTHQIDEAESKLLSDEG